MAHNIRGHFAHAATVFVSALLALMPVAAEASRVSPMIVELRPTGRDAVARIELTNDADRDIPYEVQMMRGEISPDGDLALTPADEEFIVFPPQAIVEKRSQQVFRVQYVGQEALEESQIFYLSVKQIPVAFEEGENALQVVVNYNVLVNVIPENTTAVADVRSATYVEREISTEGLAEDDISDPIPLEKGLVVDLGNAGSRFFFAGRSSWSISAITVAGEPFNLNYGGDEMSQFIGAGVVAPGKNRLFFIPTEVAIDSSTLQISIVP